MECQFPWLCLFFSCFSLFQFWFQIVFVSSGIWFYDANKHLFCNSEVKVNFSFSDFSLFHKDWKFYVSLYNKRDSKHPHGCSSLLHHFQLISLLSEQIFRQSDPLSKWRIFEGGPREGGNYTHIYKIDNIILSFVTLKFHWQVFCASSSDLFNYHNF